jgi:ThiF family
MILLNIVMLGQNIRRLYPSAQNSPIAVNPIYHRQSLLFGAAGQELLRRSKVGIIGLGGVGSLLNEWMAHLGVGEIVGIDFDKVEPSNQPRVVGSRPSDAYVFLSTMKWSALQRLGRCLAKFKAKVAKRLAKNANPRVHYRAVVDTVTRCDASLLLKDTDFIFLCADSAQARLIFNALVHQYQIPGIQVGSKVPVDKETGEIGEIFAVSRPVLPFATGGCLLCNGLISAAKLQEEALSELKRRRQTYVEDELIFAPSVVTLNAVAAAQAANDFLLGYFGLFNKIVRRGYLMQFCREHHWSSVDCKTNPSCLHCGSQSRSILARGDRVILPCRR